MNNESCCLCRRKGSRIVDENIAHLLLKLGFNNDPSLICVWCEKVLKKIGKFLQYIKLSQETIVDDYNPYIFTIQKLDSITIMPTFNEVYIDETVPEYHENSCTENDEMINCDWDNVGEKNSSTNTDFEVIYLSQEEQLEDIENKKKADKYMNKKYKCELCGVGFLTDDVLQEHNFRHSYEAGDHICAICKLHFKTNLVLAQHKLAHRRRFKCVLCKKRFKRWSHALEHGTKCGVWDNVACDVCEKVFRDNNSLNIHKKIHTKERNFICDECNKGFRTRQHLIIHLRSHTGVKPFGCTECDKTFSTHSNLKAHSIVHEKEKLFFCVECNKRYKSEKSLRRHFVSSLKHVQEREFSCTQCDRKFISQISLSSHIRNVHLMTYKCNICEKIFSNNSNLKKHVRCVHSKS
ncbi:zinc finger protein 675-like [Colias croceus]|uniref:zinc finger protein 675-like n=1 Tax=Colias crocea TaxID=72248 RepID=UPI001E2807C1|nr:zinc finger protein 675-like [Colias croceus]